MTENELTNGPTYTTLRSIEERKAQLLKEIRKDSLQMNKLRQQLFEKPKLPTKKSGFMPSKLVSNGASVLDGLLLAWKLYRKFKKK
ncbi:MAG: hypothetical protein J5953_07650 [Prevotella sp.]|jgi:hypothetical protein|nr:hypothetical protein [Prevotella sp.]